MGIQKGAVVQIALAIIIVSNYKLFILFLLKYTRQMLKVL